MVNNKHVAKLASIIFDQKLHDGFNSFRNHKDLYKKYIERLGPKLSDNEETLSTYNPKLKVLFTDAEKILKSSKRDEEKAKELYNLLQQEEEATLSNLTSKVIVNLESVTGTAKKLSAIFSDNAHKLEEIEKQFEQGSISLQEAANKQAQIIKLIMRGETSLLEKLGDSNEDNVTNEQINDALKSLPKYGELLETKNFLYWCLSSGATSIAAMQDCITDLINEHIFEQHFLNDIETFGSLSKEISLLYLDTFKIVQTEISKVKLNAKTDIQVQEYIEANIKPLFEAHEEAVNKILSDITSCEQIRVDGVSNDFYGIDELSQV
jgi:hypothetical protein